MVAGEKPESQRELTDFDIDSLDENMDYSLLTSISDDCNNIEKLTSKTYENSDGTKEVGVLKPGYHTQYKRRIVTSQSFLRLMLTFMQDATDVKIEENLQACWVSQFGSLLSLGGLRGEGEKSSGTSAQMKAKVVPKWSQAIDFGSPSVENNVWTLTLRLCHFASLCVQEMQSSSTGDDDHHDRLLSIQAIASLLVHSFTELQTELLTTENRYVSSATAVEGHVHVLLQPAWIKMVSECGCCAGYRFTCFLLLLCFMLCLDFLLFVTSIPFQKFDMLLILEPQHTVAHNYNDTTMTPQ